ncbi:MAG: ion transporter [Gemmatimonadota bacterium]
MDSYPSGRTSGYEPYPDSPWRARAFEIIFEHDTPAGKAFDVVLILAILASVVVIMLDSVQGIAEEHGRTLQLAEWGFTGLFTVEYVLRLLAVKSRSRYAGSFLGLIDLFAILPTYLGLLFPAGRYLLSIRILRVLRVFRVLKLAHFVGEANILTQALRASRHKIAVFLFTVLTISVVVASLLYLIEGPEAGFTSIPRSMYWAIVTLTTVGYGDITPASPFGQLLAAMVMIMGYGIIAVPTGIVSVEIATATRLVANARVCPSCGLGNHEADARHCRRCGGSLSDEHDTETGQADLDAPPTPERGDRPPGAG